MVNRGDVCWIEHPEGGGRRPACVVTREDAIPVLKLVTVATVTSTIRGVRSEVHLSKVDGVRHECVISLDNLYTVPRHRLGRPIAQLSATKMREVCRALDFATGCRC